MNYFRKALAAAALATAAMGCFDAPKPNCYNTEIKGVPAFVAEQPLGDGHTVSYIDLNRDSVVDVSIERFPTLREVFYFTSPDSVPTFLPDDVTVYPRNGISEIGAQYRFEETKKKCEQRGNK